MKQREKKPMRKKKPQNPTWFCALLKQAKKDDWSDYEEEDFDSSAKDAVSVLLADGRVANYRAGDNLATIQWYPGERPETISEVEFYREVFKGTRARRKRG